MIDIIGLSELHNFGERIRFKTNVRVGIQQPVTGGLFRRHVQCMNLAQPSIG